MKTTVPGGVLLVRGASLVLVLQTVLDAERTYRRTADACVASASPGAILAAISAAYPRDSTLQHLLLRVFVFLRGGCVYAGHGRARGKPLSSSRSSLNLVAAAPPLLSLSVGFPFVPLCRARLRRLDFASLFAHERVWR